MEDLSLKERNLFDSFDSSSDEVKKRERNLFDFLESSTDLMKPVQLINGDGDHPERDCSPGNNEQDGRTSNDREESSISEASGQRNGQETNRNTEEVGIPDNHKENSTGEGSGSTDEGSRGESEVPNDISVVDSNSEQCDEKDAEKEPSVGGSEVSGIELSREESSTSNKEKDVSETSRTKQAETNKTTCNDNDHDLQAVAEPDTESDNEIKTTYFSTSSMKEGAVLDEVDGTLRSISQKDLSDKDAAEPSQSDDVNIQDQLSIPNQSGIPTSTGIPTDVKEQTKDKTTANEEIETEILKRLENVNSDETSVNQTLVTDEKPSNTGKEKKTDDHDNIKAPITMGTDISVSDLDEESQNLVIDLTDTEFQNSEGKNSKPTLQSQFSEGFSPYDDSNDVEKLQKTGTTHSKVFSDEKESSLSHTCSKEDSVIKVGQQKNGNDLPQCEKSVADQTKDVEEIEKLLQEYCRSTNDGKVDVSDEGNIAVTFKMKSTEVRSEKNSIDKGTEINISNEATEETLRQKAKKRKISTEESWSAVGQKRCPHCLFTTDQQGLLDTHISTCGKKKDKKEEINLKYKDGRFGCQNCLNAFTEKKKFEEHVAFHLLQEPYICLSCMVTFDSKRKIEIHVKEKHAVEMVKCGLRGSKKITNIIESLQKVGEYSFLGRQLNQKFASFTRDDKSKRNNLSSKTQAPDKDKTILSVPTIISQAVVVSPAFAKSSVSSAASGSALLKMSSSSISTEASSLSSSSSKTTFSNTSKPSISKPTESTFIPLSVTEYSSKSKLLKPISSNDAVKEASKSSTLARGGLLPGIPTVVHSAVNAKGGNSRLVSIVPKAQLAMTTSSSQPRLGQSLSGNPVPAQVQTTSSTTLRPVISNQVQSPPVILFPAGNILVPVTYPKINLLSTPGNVGSLAFNPGATLHQVSQRVTLQPAIPITQTGIINVPKPQILSPVTTPNTSILIFPNSSTSVTTDSGVSLLQNSSTNKTFNQSESSNGVDVQSPVTPIVHSTFTASTVSSSTISTFSSSKSSTVTSNGGKNISNPTGISGSQDPQEKGNKKLFFKKSGTSYNCELCKFEVKDETSFTRHVWNHFHVDQKICKTCQIETDDQKSCQLVKQVMEGLHSAAEIAAKERKQKSKKSENEQATAIETKDVASTGEIVILDEDTDDMGGKNEIKQDGKEEGEVDESGGVSGIKILSTYSLSTKRKETVSEESVSSSNCNKKGETSDSNADAENSQGLQKVISEVIEKNIREPHDTSSKELKETGTENSLNVEQRKTVSDTVEESAASTSITQIKSSDTSAKKDSPLHVTPCTYFYQCGFHDCSFASYTSNSYRDHLATVHPKSCQYNCVHCGHQSVTDESHMRHIIGHSKQASSVLFLCGEGCKFGTNLLNSFKEHILKVHPNLLDYKCASCKEIFQDVETLIRHLESNKLQFVLCPHCTFKDRNRRTVMKHLTEIHPGKARQITVTSQLVCLERCLNNYKPPRVTPTLCVPTEDKKAEKVESYEGKSQGAIENTVAASSIMDKSEETMCNDIASVNDVQDDERNAKPDNPPTKGNNSDNCYFQCTECTYLTQSKGILGNHILSHSRPRSSRSFACPQCSSGNDNLPQFSAHMKHHEGEFKVKVYMCFHCPYQTNQKDRIMSHGLKKHNSNIPDVDYSVRTHKYRETAFHCQDCEYIHKDEKIFCDHVKSCHGKSVSEKKPSDTVDYLKKESDNEEDDLSRPHVSKKFTCSHCRRGFDRLAQLKQHMNIHILKEDFINVFKCGYCPFLSTHEYLVPKHIQEKHPKYQISVKQKREYLQTKMSPEKNAFESSEIDLLHCDCCSFSCNDVHELAQHTAVHLAGSHTEPRPVEQPKAKKPYEGPKKKFYIPFGNIFRENIHCSECGFKTKRRLELLRHIKGHENLEPVSQLADRKENSVSENYKKPFLKIKFGKRKPPSDYLSSVSKKRCVSGSESDLSDDEWEPPLSPVSKKKQVAVKSTTQSPKSNKLSSFYYLGGDVLHLKLRPCYSKDEEEPMFECLLCKDVFEEKYSLHRHLLQHMTVSFFKCSYCDHGELETSALVSHIQKEHRKPIKHEQIDQKEIESKINKVIHEMKAEEYWGIAENESITPENEGLKQETSSSYEDIKQDNMKSAVNEKDSFQPLSCVNIKEEPKELEADIQSTHSSSASENSSNLSDGKSPRLGPLPQCVVMMGRFFKCTVCNHRVDNRYNIIMHAQKHSSRKRHMCSMCSYRSHYKGDVTKHVKMVHHNVGQVLYDFEDIDIDAKYLLLDEVRKQNINNAVCISPDISQADRSKKGTRDDFDSKGNSTRKYQCPYCEYRSNWTGDMKRHIERHHPGQKYKVIRDVGTYVKQPIKKFSLKLGKAVKREAISTIPDVTDSGKKVQTFVGMRSFYKCLLCSQTFRSRQKIFLHLRTTKCKRNLWRCSVCKKYKCDKERIVQEHIKENHPNNSDAKASLCNQKGKIRIHKVPKSVFKTSSNDENRSEEPPSKVPKITEAKSKDDQPPGGHVKFVGDRWACFKCNYRSASKANVVRHVITHTDVKKYKCPVCEYRGRLETTVKKHMSICHPGEDKGVVKLLCDNESATTSTVVKEEKGNNNENPGKNDTFQKFYKCLVCGVLLNSVSGLYKHLRKVCTTPMYGCSECNLKSIYESSVKRHIKKQHRNASCDTLQIRSKMKVVKVSKNIDIEESSKENTVGKDNTKLTSLKLKIETVQSSSKQSDRKQDSDLKECPACNFPVNSYKALRIHFNTVHPKHRLLCLYCKEYVTKKVMQLVTHNRQFHGKDGFSELNFDILSESDVRSKNLDHRPIILYKCGLCDHTTQRQPLRFHLYLHFQYSPYKCKYCDASFKSVKVLKHIQAKHPGKKLEYDYQKDEKLEKEITNMLENGRYQTISQSSYKLNESVKKVVKEEIAQKDSDEKEEHEEKDESFKDDEGTEREAERQMDEASNRGDPKHMFSPCHNYTVDYDMKTGKNIYQCSICPYNTTVVKTITNHFYHHVPHVFKCPYCSYQNYPRSKVVCHLKYKHPKKTVHVVDLRNKMKNLKFREYEMDVEKPVTTPKSKKTEHVKSPKKKQKGLERLEDIFTSEESDDDNESAKTDGSRNGRLVYCCNYCTKELDSLYHYRQHLATHGGFLHQVPGSQIESRLKCGYCAYLAADDNDFKRHMEAHFNARPYSCPYCSFSQYRPSAIKNHINSSHPGKPVDVIKDQSSSCLIEENTPKRQVMLVEMDPKVKVNDILAMDAADFENLLTKHGVSVIDLNFILDEKFESVSKTLGLHEDVVEDDDNGLSDISDDDNVCDDTINDETKKGEGKRDDKIIEQAVVSTNDEQMETDNEFESLDLKVENIESPSDPENLHLKYEDVSEEENEEEPQEKEPTYEDISDNDEI